MDRETFCDKLVGVLEGAGWDGDGAAKLADNFNEFLETAGLAVGEIEDFSYCLQLVPQV